MVVEVVGRKTFYVTCAECGSELRYTYLDVYEHAVNHDYLEDFDRVKGIECPVCHTVVKHKN